jgi:hypothetical protein
VPLSQQQQHFLSVYEEKEQENTSYVCITITNTMMSTNKTLPTLLEHLPIEIILLIFDFLSLQEIVKAFSELNIYFNSIIDSAIGISHMVKYNDPTAIKLLHLFTTQIRRLVITSSDMVNFISLINLRSLTLRYATCAQLDSIRPQYCPTLEILHIYVDEECKFKRIDYSNFNQT